jgi:glycerophosphoryl diester phosphodiesterase
MPPSPSSSERSPAGRLAAGDRWLWTTPIAHRGLHDLDAGRPENSLAAFERACRAGFPIELDVRLTADGQAAVFHDRDLRRLTGEAGRVAAVPAARLTRLRLLGTGERVPLLQDALRLVAGRVPVLVEVKNEGRPGRLEARVLHVLAGYDGPVAVQSFNPLSLRFFRSAAPRYPRGQLGGRLAGLDPARRLLVRYLLGADLGRPGFVGYQWQALPALPVTVCRRLGLPVLAWTVCSEADRSHAMGLADNVIFEGFLPRPDEVPAGTPGR